MAKQTERRGRKRKTTARMYCRGAKLAKAQPMVSSRRIKEDLRLPVNTVIKIDKKLSKEHIDCHDKKWCDILWTGESKIEH